MRNIVFLLLLIPAISFASGHEYWRINEYPTISEKNLEREMMKEQRMLQGLQRELRETGKIAPKDHTDIYNLREGYGYDGGRTYPQYQQGYDYGY